MWRTVSVEPTVVSPVCALVVLSCVCVCVCFSVQTIEAWMDMAAAVDFADSPKKQAMFDAIGIRTVCVHSTIVTAPGTRGGEFLRGGGRKGAPVCLTHRHTSSRLPMYRVPMYRVTTTTAYQHRSCACLRVCLGTYHCHHVGVCALVCAVVCPCS